MNSIFYGITKSETRLSDFHLKKICIYFGYAGSYVLCGIFSNCGSQASH